MLANYRKPNLQIVPDVIETDHLLIDEEKAARLLLTRLSEFVETLDDEYLNMEPWSIFNAWLDCHFDPTSSSLSLFRSWQFFHWRPEPDTVKQSLFTPEAATIASVYARMTTAQLSAEELAILESADKQRLDLYEVVGIQENYLTLYGTITRAKVVVFNTDMSSKARLGEYLLANVFAVDSLRSIFIGKSPFISRECRPAIADFCDFIERCHQDLPREFKSFESDVFNLFYDLTRDYPPAR